MSDDPVGLTLVVKLLRQLQTEQAAMRDDRTVDAAILNRIDGTLGRVLDQLRAMHSQHDRMAARVRALEVRE